MTKLFNIFSRDEKRHQAKARKAFLFVLFAFCLMPFSFSAPKPVTVIVSLSPPYSPFLNEYGSSGVDKLQVSLIVNDSRLLNHPGKLQMLIEHVGSGIVMRTSEYAAIAPIMLTGNVTEVFNGFDLNKYFLAQNNVFTGFDQSQYMQTGRIPDGQYRIGFRVVDAQRPEIVLSNTAYTQAGWFVLNDPPQINLPRNKEKVRVNDLQNVKLEWFPRHLGSLNAAFATSYQIELFAIRIPGMNPNQVAMSMQPDFTDVTNRTSYNLTNDKYLLEPGVEYAYRIKAMAGDGQLTLFQNDGYSEVFSFIYGSLCPETENVSAQTLGTYKVEITWDTDPLQTLFETRFRKAGQLNDAWHTRESFIGMAEIANVLSPGVKYEYQVKATCTTVESEYSALDYFTMPYPPNAKFECGADDSVMVSNTIPKASLQEGEMIFYGQFPIKLTEVSGSNGVFTGKGRMRIPFLANIQVNMQFNGIKVNQLNEVYEGELVSIYNPDSKFLIDANVVAQTVSNLVGKIVDYLSDSRDVEIDQTITIGGTIETIYSDEDGNNVIISSSGDTTVVASDQNIAIVDSSGQNATVVTQNGEMVSMNSSASSVQQGVVDKYRQLFSYTVEPGKGIIYYCSTQGIPGAVISGVEKELKDYAKNKLYLHNVDSTSNQCMVKYNEDHTFYCKAIKKENSSTPVEFGGVYKSETVTFYLNNNLVHTGSFYKPDASLLNRGANSLEVKVKDRNGKVTTVSNYTILYKHENYRFEITREITKGSPRTDYYKHFDNLGGDTTKADLPFKLGEEFTAIVSMEDLSNPGSYIPVKNISWFIGDTLRNTGDSIRHKCKLNEISLRAKFEGKELSVSYKVRDTISTQPDNGNINNIFNVDVTNLTTKAARKRGVKMFNQAMTDISTASASIAGYNLHSFLSGNSVAIQSSLYHSSHANMTDKHGNALNGSSGAKISYYKNTYPLLDIRKITKEADNTISNAVLVRLLTDAEKIYVKNSAKDSSLNQATEGILNSMKKYDVALSNIIKDTILAGHIPDTLLKQMAYKIEANNVLDYITVNSDGYMTIYLNYDNISSLQNTFTEILAHEGLHLYWAKNKTYEKLLWMIIAEKATKYGYKLSNNVPKSSPPDNVNSSGYGCSAGDGHERNNPENEFVCKEQNNY